MNTKSFKHPISICDQGKDLLDQNEPVQFASNSTEESNQDQKERQNDSQKNVLNHDNSTDHLTNEKTTVTNRTSIN